MIPYSQSLAGSIGSATRDYIVTPKKTPPGSGSQGGSEEESANDTGSETVTDDQKSLMRGEYDAKFILENIHDRENNQWPIAQRGTYFFSENKPGKVFFYAAGMLTRKNISSEKIQAWIRKTKEEKGKSSYTIYKEAGDDGALKSARSQQESKQHAKVTVYEPNWTDLDWWKSNLSREAVKFVVVDFDMTKAISLTLVEKIKQGARPF